MPEPNDPVYRFADLSEYSFKDRLLIRLAALAFYVAIRLIGMTVRFKVIGPENVEAVGKSGKLPIYTFWHDRLFLSSYFWRSRGIVILISKSLDGEYIARVLQRFGCGAIRGSSSRGGSRGLVEMIRGMRRGLPMAFTADGPRGPRYEAKAGPVYLAKKSGNPILPYVIEPRSCWNAGSWDKTQVPKPFTRAVVIVGEPIYIDADANEAEMESKRAELQNSLDRLVERGHEWRRSS